jgi:hypothetical protein
VKQKHHGGIHRKPRRIEERKQPVSGEKLPQRGQVIEGLRRRVHAAAVQRFPKAGAVDVTTEQHIQPVADAHHDA